MQAAQSLMNTAVAPDVEPQDTAALEVSAAAAGALALPVLTWSLFTLKTTGVSLNPPGTLSMRCKSVGTRVCPDVSS